MCMPCATTCCGPFQCEFLENLEGGIHIVAGLRPAGGSGELVLCLGVGNSVWSSVVDNSSGALVDFTAG